MPTRIRCIAIVQARMSSRRLPGKVLMQLGGRPLLGILVARVRRASSLDGVIVATSKEPSDDPIAAYCGAAGVPCHRGPLEDVARRFALVMDDFPADAYVRLCADSPVMDPAVIDEVVERYAEGLPDLATNVHPRSFPPGLSVEVLNPTTFRRTLPSFSTAEHREHVTRYFYEHADRFRILNVTNPTPLPPLDLSIDTEEQWLELVRLWQHLGSRWDVVGWREVAEYVLSRPPSRERACS